MFEQIRRSVRALGLLGLRTSSTARLLWYRCAFDGLSVGRGVVLEPGATIRVIKGSTLILGNKIRIERNAMLVSEGYLSIGDHGFIGRATTIVAVARIVIGHDALIASGCVIRDHNHGATRDGIPYRLQPLVSGSILIGPNVWIGANACILKGVVIGENAIIGAGAVVITSIPENAVAVGVPARLRSAPKTPV